MTPQEAVRVLRAAGCDCPAELREAAPSVVTQDQVDGGGLALPVPLAAVLRHKGLSPLRLTVGRPPLAEVMQRVLDKGNRRNRHE